jgi:hypothetical protein
VSSRWDVDGTDKIRGERRSWRLIIRRDQEHEIIWRSLISPVAIATEGTLARYHHVAA